MAGHAASPDDALPLAAAFAPGSPLAAEVEALLNEAPPVPVDDREAEAAVEALLVRLGGARPRRSRRSWGALGVTLGLVAALAAAVALPRPGPEGVDAASGEGLELSPDVVATRVGRSLRLDRGAAVFTRDAGTAPPVDRIRLGPLDVWLVPVGTRFAAASDGRVGAVAVAEGTVVVEREGRPLAHLGEGDEVVLVGVDGRVLVADPGDVPRSLGSLAADADELLAGLRWSLLPAETRAALGGAR